ncbi:UMP-CMP kinase 1-like isoform X2 [Penaeus monodon]|uniref:UMP-CMP kinase 1-like isoform X2 n=1 Tax=Penaeus monodon TaxID=6687 RepID=UPI0018A78DF9|nr:UMP-CMP kinase 1-like isoform X2 [Penaeus monodon]
MIQVERKAQDRCAKRTSRPIQLTSQAVHRLVRGKASMAAQYNVVFMLGPPGAGKGTQSNIIAQTFGYDHVCVGDLLKGEVKQPDSAIGRLIKEQILSNTIVSWTVTCPLLERYMKESRNKNFVIDGFPRTQDNFDGWNLTLGNKVNLQCVFFLSCPFELCTERCLGRGAAGSGRPDDNEASLQKRFDTFSNDTVHILNWYEKRGLLRTIDGAKSIEEVAADVKSHFIKL